MTEAVVTYPVRALRFLHERLDEEEKFIDAVHLMSSIPIHDEDGEPEGFFTTRIPEMSEYITTYQPNRTRAEVALKRTILSRFKEYELKRWNGELIRVRVNRRDEHHLLFEMAKLYENHEDYDKMWQPDDTP